MDVRTNQLILTGILLCGPKFKAIFQASLAVLKKEIYLKSGIKIYHIDHLKIMDGWIYGDSFMCLAIHVGDTIEGKARF